MIRPLPWCRLIQFWRDLYPLFGLPIKDTDSIVPNFIGAASPEDDDSLVMAIVIHRAVGSLRRYFSRSIELVPFHGEGVEGPKIIHIV
jgi:hypothetical protein